MSCEAGQGKAVDVAREEADRPGVAGEHLGQKVLIEAAERVDEADAGGELRLVHHAERGCPRRIGEGGVEPGGVVGGDKALAVAGDVDVKADHADGAVGDGIKCAGCWERHQGRQIGEARAKGLTVVVVAGDGEDGRREGGEQAAGLRAAFRIAVFGQLAGEDQEVGAEARRLGKGLGKARGGVEDGLVELTIRADVRVGEVGDEYRLGPRAVGRYAHPTGLCLGWRPCQVGDAG